MRTLACFWFILASLTGAQAAAEPTVVRVVGAATAQAEPEQAEFFFGVVTYADDADRAAEEGAAKTRAAIEALKERLGADAQIQTMSYAIMPNRKYSKRGPEEVTGYSVENTLRVTVDDISDLGAILDLVSGAGANQIRAVHFAVKDNAALRARAFQEAVANARASADAIARALGREVSRIVAVEEQGVARDYGSIGSVTETISVGPTPIVAGAVQQHVRVILTAEVGP